MPYPFAGPGVIPALKQLVTNRITLQSGEVELLSPAGWYCIRPGRYSAVQQFDPITGIWFGIGGASDPGGVLWIYSDGANFRLANQTGCPVGALLTTAGSGYTSAPTVTASAGSSLWKAYVGGAINTTVSVTNGGSGYTYPPLVLFSAPPNIQQGGGIPASGYSTLSGGAVSTVTVTNQGAGYPSAPTITFVNDPRETNVPVAIGGTTVTAGSGAAAVATLTGSQTVTGVVCLDHGQGGQTSVPTLAFAGGGGSSAAATAIMCWTATAYTTSGGTGYPNIFEISGVDVFPTTAAAYTNPDTQANLVRTRKASIKAIASAGVPTATGLIVNDGGIYTAQPTALAATNTLITAGATLALTMGGLTDTSYVMTP
jgi:hypothetical protein